MSGMETQLPRQALLTILEEILTGPPDPKGTWVVSNEVGSGILGTLRKLDEAKAFARPAGAQRSIAEHAAHVRFALRVSLRYAKGDRTHANWKESWHFDENWPGLIASLEETVLATQHHVASDEAFAGADAIALFVSCVAHAAYHLGAIRQLAVLT